MYLLKLLNSIFGDYNIIQKNITERAKENEDSSSNYTEDDDQIITLKSQDNLEMPINNNNINNYNNTGLD